MIRSVHTILLLVLSNTFMTLAWYGLFYWLTLSYSGSHSPGSICWISFPGIGGLLYFQELKQ